MDYHQHIENNLNQKRRIRHNQSEITSSPNQNKKSDDIRIEIPSGLDEETQKQFEQMQRLDNKLKNVNLEAMMTEIETYPSK